MEIYIRLIVIWGLLSNLGCASTPNLGGTPCASINTYQEEKLLAFDPNIINLKNIKDTEKFVIESKKRIEYFAYNNTDQRNMIPLLLDKISCFALHKFMSKEAAEKAIGQLISYAIELKEKERDVSIKLRDGYRELDAVKLEKGSISLRDYQIRGGFDTELAAYNYVKSHQTRDITINVATGEPVQYKNVITSKITPIPVSHTVTVEAMDSFNDSGIYFFKAGEYIVNKNNYSKNFSEFIDRALTFIKNYKDSSPRNVDLIDINGKFEGGADNTGGAKCPAYYDGDINKLESIKVNDMLINKGCISNLQLAHLRAYSIYVHFMDLLWDAFKIKQSNYSTILFDGKVYPSNGKSKQYRFAKVSITFGGSVNSKEEKMTMRQ